MKVSVFLISVLVFTTVSCSTSKKLSSSSRDITGEWHIKSIVTEGIPGNPAIPIFFEADFSCFIGSVWSFSENGTGNYKILASGGNSQCAPLERKINWKSYVSRSGDLLLQFKKLDSKNEEIDPGRIGNIFALKFTGTGEAQWKYDLLIENKPASLVFNFIKDK